MRFQTLINTGKSGFSCVTEQNAVGGSFGGKFVTFCYLVSQVPTKYLVRLPNNIADICRHAEQIHEIVGISNFLAEFRQGR